MSRGSTGAANRDVIEAAWAERPDGVPSFGRGADADGVVRVRQLIHVTVWRVRPAALEPVGHRAEAPA